MPQLRPYLPRDRSAVADICLRTAAAGVDATGMLPDDALWADLFVLPYVTAAPDWAWVVADDDDTAQGYVVVAADTAAFETWFRREWWPEHAPRYGRGIDPEMDRLLTYGDGRGFAAAPYLADHPAHLHIDLLPGAQGQGWGRRLIDTAVQALQARGVVGLHLVADPANAGALAFYPRLGFSALPDEPGGFARAL